MPSRIYQTDGLLVAAELTNLVAADGFLDAGEAGDGARRHTSGTARDRVHHVSARSSGQLRIARCASWSSGLSEKLYIQDARKRSITSLKTNEYRNQPGRRTDAVRATSTARDVRFVVEFVEL